MTDPARVQVRKIRVTGRKRHEPKRFSADGAPQEGQRRGGVGAAGSFPDYMAGADSEEEDAMLEAAVEPWAGQPLGREGLCGERGHNRRTCPKTAAASAADNSEGGAMETSVEEGDGGRADAASEERCESCSRRFISKHALRIHLQRNVNCRPAAGSEAASSGAPSEPAPAASPVARLPDPFDRACCGGVPLTVLATQQARTGGRSGVSGARPADSEQHPREDNSAEKPQGSLRQVCSTRACSRHAADGHGARDRAQRRR